MDLPNENHRDLPSIAEILRSNQEPNRRWSGSYYADDPRPLSPEFFNPKRVNSLYRAKPVNPSLINLQEEGPPHRRCLIYRRLQSIRSKIRRLFPHIKSSILQKTNKQSSRTDEDQSPTMVIRVVSEIESSTNAPPKPSPPRAKLPFARSSVPPPPPPKICTRNVPSLATARARDAHVEKGRYIMSKAARRPSGTGRETSYPSNTPYLNGVLDVYTNAVGTPTHIVNCLKPRSAIQ